MSEPRERKAARPGGSTAARLVGVMLALEIFGAGARAGSAPAAAAVTEMAFLSPDRVDPAEAARAPPAGRDLPESNTSFDGRWIFTSAGCPYTGSLRATIRRGRIIVKGGGGTVSPDGTLHSVGAGGGMTVTSVGTLSGGTGSGTFNRSDGCVGSWIAIRR